MWGPKGTHTKTQQSCKGNHVYREEQESDKNDRRRWECRCFISDILWIQRTHGKFQNWRLARDDVHQRELNQMTRALFGESLMNSIGQNEMSPLVLSHFGGPRLWVMWRKGELGAYKEGTEFWGICPIAAGKVEITGEAILLCTGGTSEVSIISS